MSLRDFSLYHMESLKSWSLLHEYIILLMIFTTVSKGSACEAPSNPECFRRTADESVYRCEWSMKNTTERDVTFHFYIQKVKVRIINTTWFKINEKQLLKNRPVNISVEAHIGNSSCTSTRRSVVLSHTGTGSFSYFTQQHESLKHCYCRYYKVQTFKFKKQISRTKRFCFSSTVKYEAPKHISMSWLKNNLSLSWTASEEHPAAAEILLRRDAHRTESWEKKTTNTTSDTLKYHVLVVNLSKDSAYQVQIRHRPTKALNPLWSDWSPVVIVPAELEQKPEVTMTTTLLNGTRNVTLSWKRMPNAVMYSLSDTQSSKGCPCKKNRDPINMTETTYTTFVSYSAVNISVIGRNAAGSSPPAILQLPAVPAAELKICENTLLKEKLKKKTCLELYELQDGDLRPRSVSVTDIKDYVRYLYFEHRCHGSKPWTVKMCLVYQKEGVPLRKPQDFIAFSETHTSAHLSWKAIPSADQRGFLTHYSLCSVKVSSQDERKECHNISASVMKYRLGNLTPRAKYNVSLVGVTGVGEGPEATVTVNTLPEKPVNVWWSLCLLFLFFILTTMCTCILKRIKGKILPAVPTPVISDFNLDQPMSQDFLERKENVHKLTLLQLHPEGKDKERGDSRMSGGSSDECFSPGSNEEALRGSRGRKKTDMEQLDNEIEMLIYRNGLVFDVKRDSL
ncbi:uncharacterized protein LOC134869481 isoform X2 [Eleginops maclovinus]|uniref:uncharacterized protein LOC134869481 isoform X2 n=1 Tax=Eleginops maclovinus TaxID=56733 RepID=UPI003080B241